MKLRLLQLVILGCLRCCLSEQQQGSRAQPSNDCSSGSRSSYLWRVDRQPPVYLFGTIHVPYTAVWHSLSRVVKLALSSVRVVHFELDLTSHSTLQELSRCQMIADDRTQLEDLLPDGLTDRISRYLSSLSQHLAQPHQAAVFSALTQRWRRRRPIWLALNLASLTPADLAAFGTDVLDVFLTHRARRQGQQVQALESVDDQCRPLNAIPAGEAALALNLTLTHLEEQLARFLGNRQRPEESQQPATDLIRRYRCGTLDEDFAANNASFLPTEAVARLSPDQLALYRSLLRKLKRSLVERRNRRMADRIVQAMEADRVRAQLFAVGIGHLLGEGHSIVSHLRTAGFTVRLMSWNRTDPSLPAEAATNLQDEPEEPSSQDSERNRDWRVGEQLKQREQQEAARAAEWAIWEEAKRYARLKWRPPNKEPTNEEQWGIGESINLIKSAGRSPAGGIGVWFWTMLGLLLLLLH